MSGKDLGAVVGTLAGAYTGYKTAVAAGLIATGIGAAYVAAGTLIGWYAGRKVGLCKNKITSFVGFWIIVVQVHA